MFETIPVGAYLALDGGASVQDFTFMMMEDGIRQASVSLLAHLETSTLTRVHAHLRCFSSLKEARRAVPFPKRPWGVTDFAYYLPYVRVREALDFLAFFHKDMTAKQALLMVSRLSFAGTVWGLGKFPYANGRLPAVAALLSSKGGIRFVYRDFLKHLWGHLVSAELWEGACCPVPWDDENEKGTL